MKSPREHAQAPLPTADNDLIAATATLETGKALDTVCFHGQQAAEKSLKAILALNNIPYPFRHDLGELTALVKRHHRLDAALEAGILALTPYAIAARYDDVISPTPDEARIALEIAQKACAFAEKVLAP